MNPILFEELNLNLEGRIIFLDIDGTLIADGSQLDFEPKILNKINFLRQKNQIFLCTNSSDRIRSNKIERALSLPIATYNHKKPSSKIIKELGIGKENKNFLVIGDKVLIDGLFALNIGAEFIKVKRKISGQESLVIKLINLADDLICQVVKLRWFLKN
ncbi:MAG: hypothetical protein Q7S73_03160 [bacterium]|nr:hypothetical protein [bacterium]